MDNYDRMKAEKVRILKSSDDLPKLFLAMAVLCMLSGCTASQRTTETFKRDKDGNIVKVTKTVTETVKEEKDVPVTKHVSTIRSATKTTGGTQPLHKAEVLSGDAKSTGVAPGAIPEPVKTP